MRCAYVGCVNVSAAVFVSCTDGMMSLHDEDDLEALCLFMCDHVYAHVVIVALHKSSTMTHM